MYNTTAPLLCLRTYNLYPNIYPNKGIHPLELFFDWNYNRTIYYCIFGRSFRFGRHSAATCHILSGPVYKIDPISMNTPYLRATGKGSPAMCQGLAWTRILF